MKHNPIVSDKLPGLLLAMAKLVNTEVLVGIPASAGVHKSEDGEEPINKAQLGYILDGGSPSANIPARPFLVPGVRDAQTDVVAGLRQAADGALTGKPAAVQAGFVRAGIKAQSAVRAKLNSNIAPALSPETIARRAQSRGTKSVRKSEKKYAQLLDQGIDARQAQSQAGIVALVNTGELRNSVTYVIKAKKAT
jgi:hypothetical protein